MSTRYSGDARRPELDAMIEAKRFIVATICDPDEPIPQAGNAVLQTIAMSNSDEHKVATPLSGDAGRLARVTEVIADVSLRLAGVCGHLSGEEFDAFMRQIAELTVKYEALAEARAVRIDSPPAAQP